LTSRRRKNDLLSRVAVIAAINNLMESPYANSPQFGKERKEAMETVKAMCVTDIPTAYDIDGVIKQMEDRKDAALLEAKGIPPERIRKYGFAFEGKTVLIG